jgi:hypothetical protein
MVNQTGIRMAPWMIMKRKLVYPAQMWIRSAWAGLHPIAANNTECRVTGIRKNDKAHTLASPNVYDVYSIPSRYTSTSGSSAPASSAHPNPSTVYATNTNVHGITTSQLAMTLKLGSPRPNWFTLWTAKSCPYSASLVGRCLRILAMREWNQLHLVSGNACVVSSSAHRHAANDDGPNIPITYARQCIVAS